MALFPVDLPVVRLNLLMNSMCPFWAICKTNIMENQQKLNAMNTALLNDDYDYLVILHEISIGTIYNFLTRHFWHTQILSVLLYLSWLLHLKPSLQAMGSNELHHYWTRHLEAMTQFIDFLFLL